MQKQKSKDFGRRVKKFNVTDRDINGTDEKIVSKTISENCHRINISKTSFEYLMLDK